MAARESACPPPQAQARAMLDPVTHPGEIRTRLVLCLAGLCWACGDGDSDQRSGSAGLGGAAGAAAGGSAAGSGGSEAGAGGTAAGSGGGGGGAATGGSTTGGAATGGAGTGGATLDTGFTRYDPSAVTSPITPSVALEAERIASRNPSARDSVFMKVGASGTVSRNFLYCFAGSSQPNYDLQLEGRDLLPSINYFRSGDVAGSTPFDRATLAAVVGRSAGWAIAGDPSPVSQELDLLQPRFAFVNYGTNDMGLGATYLSALFPFFANMTSLLDQLEARGVVSVISGLNPRGDSTSAARWVPT